MSIKESKTKKIVEPELLEEKALLVYKIVEISGVKYGLVTKSKVDNAVSYMAKNKDATYTFGEREKAQKDVLIAVIYDRHGGLIVNENGVPLKNGIFWDYENKKPMEGIFEGEEATAEIAPAPTKPKKGETTKSESFDGKGDVEEIKK